MLKSDNSGAGPVLDEFGSSGDNSWLCRTVVLDIASYENNVTCRVYSGKERIYNTGSMGNGMKGP